MTERASCSECPGSFELIPPADKDYCVPKLSEPEPADFIKRFYECESEGHRNTIYWTKKDYGGRVVVSKGFSSL